MINEHKTWGSKFIENLAADIRISFPNVKGYSVRNLKYMAKFAETYPDEEFVQTVSAQIPWSHNVAILDKVKTEEQREWYIRKTAENGWSHSVLVHQIESNLYERQVIANKGATFYAVSVAVCKLVATILSSSDSVATVSSMMHGEYGIEDVCLSTLTLVGPKGVQGKIPMRMTKEEVEKLKASADALKAVIAQIEH